MDLPVDLPIGVNAILFDDYGNLLLGKRKNAIGAGLFSLIGGHLKLGETIESCIVRELFEEVGIIVYEADVDVVNFAFVNFNVPMIEVGVLIKSYSGIPTIKEPMYCESLEFFSFDNLPKIFVGTKANVDLYRKNAFYDVSCNYYG